MYAASFSAKSAGAVAGLLTFAFLYAVTAGVLAVLAVAVVTGVMSMIAFWPVFTAVTVAGAVYGWRHP